MQTELRQREYDGKWVLWGTTFRPKADLADWTDTNTPLPPQWVPLKVYDLVGDLG